MKRIVDLLGAAFGLVVLSPLFLLVALAVKLESRGPVFYRALRAGLHNKPFKALKFRSMRVDTDNRHVITAPGDARITRIGAWLRLFKLDELPQLWNVLVGEMSLVGPRAEDVDIVQKYYTPDQMRVLNVRPGMTGIGQVTFFPDMTGEVPEGVDPHEFYLRHQLGKKLAVDLQYVDKHSTPYDLWILLRTLYAVLVKTWWILFVSPPRELKRPNPSITMRKDDTAEERAS